MRLSLGSDLELPSCEFSVRVLVRGCMPPQEAFHQFLAFKGCYEVVPVKVNCKASAFNVRIDSGVGYLSKDWQLRVAGRRAMLLGRAHVHASSFLFVHVFHWLCFVHGLFFKSIIVNQ